MGSTRFSVRRSRMRKKRTLKRVLPSALRLLGNATRGHARFASHSTTSTYTYLGPCTPVTRFISMSAVLLGPLMTTILDGI